MFSDTGASSSSSGVSSTRCAQVARLLAVARDGGTQPVEPERLQREPYLERPEPARQVDPVLAEPRIAAGEPALGRGQIVGPQRERRPMRRFVADQHAPGLIGDVQPLVEVERQRVRPLDACQPRRQRRHQHRQPAKGRVDVEPQALRLAQLGQRLQVVDGTGVDGAGRAHDAERLQPGRRSAAIARSSAASSMR